jgi:hypothetical protein
MAVIHALVASVVGEMSLAMARTSGKRSQLVDWAARLRRAADEIDKLTNREKSK